jgi:O-acetyl-ADP-ribose deacetylase (regulator of RNase III)
MEVKMKIITGDLIEMAKNGEFDVIVHGCNCFNTMGGGVAALIKKEFPEAWQADRATIVGNPRKLGTISFAMSIPEAGDARANLIVVNAYTQFRYWKDESDNPFTPLVDYVAVRDAFAAIKKQLGGQNYKFGIPKIGAGLAQGDWDIISNIIDTEMIGEDITLVKLID